MRQFLGSVALMAIVGFGGCVAVDRAQTRVHTSVVDAQSVPTTVTTVHAGGLTARGGTMIIEASTDATGVEGAVDLCKEALAKGIPCVATDPRTGMPIAQVGNVYGYGMYGGAYGAGAVSVDRYQTDQWIMARSYQQVLDGLSANQSALTRAMVDGSTPPSK